MYNANIDKNKKENHKDTLMYSNITFTSLTGHTEKKTHTQWIFTQKQKELMLLCEFTQNIPQEETTAKRI